MAMWYLNYDGQQTGPMDQAQASAQARQNPHGYAWREGFTTWIPISEIDELTSGTRLGRPTRSISRSSARRCNLSRLSSIPEKA
jgi:hypothetical protein